MQPWASLLLGLWPWTWLTNWKGAGVQAAARVPAFHLSAWEQSTVQVPPFSFKRAWNPRCSPFPVFSPSSLNLPFFSLPLHWVLFFLEGGNEEKGDILSPQSSLPHDDVCICTPSQSCHLAHTGPFSCPEMGEGQVGAQGLEGDAQDYSSRGSPIF
jgi:hypothetical protein